MCDAARITSLVSTALYRFNKELHIHPQPAAGTRVAQGRAADLLPIGAHRCPSSPTSPPPPDPHPTHPPTRTVSYQHYHSRSLVSSSSSDESGSGLRRAAGTFACPHGQWRQPLPQQGRRRRYACVKQVRSGKYRHVHRNVCVGCEYLTSRVLSVAYLVTVRTRSPV